LYFSQLPRVGSNPTPTAKTSEFSEVFLFFFTLFKSFHQAILPLITLANTTFSDSPSQVAHFKLFIVLPIIIHGMLLKKTWYCVLHSNQKTLIFVLSISKFLIKPGNTNE